jgi:hypothetical protein
MKIGFTGTRRGMSWNQREMLQRLLREIIVDEFVHGDAVGADQEAERVAAAIGSIGTCIKRLPAGTDPLARNRRIVARVDILIAAPAEDLEITRSGTWATVRYARQKPIPIIMLPRG